eukprot:scaffold48_cov311-Pinguiococcus_pyrenoidosus.AAC.187
MSSVFRLLSWVFVARRLYAAPPVKVRRVVMRIWRFPARTAMSRPASSRPGGIDTEWSEQGGLSRLRSAIVKSTSSNFSNALSQSLLDKKTFSPLNGCVQFLLVVNNTILAFAGLCVIAFFSFLFATDALDLFPSRYVDVVIVLTGAAIASVFVAFAGCVGTVRQTQKFGILQGIVTRHEVARQERPTRMGWNQWGLTLGFLFFVLRWWKVAEC